MWYKNHDFVINKRLRYFYAQCTVRVEGNRLQGLRRRSSQCMGQLLYFRIQMEIDAKGQNRDRVFPGFGKIGGIGSQKTSIRRMRSGSSFRKFPLASKRSPTTIRWRKLSVSGGSTRSKDPTTSIIRSRGSPQEWRKATGRRRTSRGSSGWTSKVCYIPPSVHR